ncbi:MAG: flagellin [Pirellulaceae bacterium]
MTRINTNVSSLIAQKTLARSNADLQTALTRLSTGLRINVGKDDPAGLIASESLRSDIISVEKAITNSERANQLIATADSALGQVSQLLNDIRGLVSEAANTGALSDDQIAANQLQLDSSLEAIDRIAQITSFQGRKLLDGSLDFITSNVNTSAIEGLQIDQANFGTLSAIGVKVNVVTQATRGQLNFGLGAIAEDVVLEVGGANGTEAFNFASASTIDEIATAVNLVSDATGVRAVVATEATQGSITVSSLGQNNDIVLTANDAGFDAGNVRVKFTEGGTTSTVANYTPSSGSGDPATIDVALRTVASVSAEGTIEDDSILAAASATFTDGGAGSNDDLVFTAKQAGAAGNDISIAINTGAGANSVAYNQATKTLTVNVTGTPAAGVIADLVNTDAVASQFVTVTNATGSDGTGTFAGSVAATKLTGGKGDVNNDLKITANFAGTAFNDANVHYVNGAKATSAGIQSANNTASLTFGGLGGGGVGQVTLTSKLAGEAGNDIKLIVDTKDSNGAATPDVAVSGNTITVTVNTDTGNINTAAEIVTAINNNASASQLVLASEANAGAITATADDAGTEFIGSAANGGRNLSNSRNATATLAGGNNTSLVVTAKEAGLAGNGVSVEIVDDGTGPSVAVTGSSIVVTTGGATTVDALATLINSNEAASRLVSVKTIGDSTANFADGAGAGTVAATSLSGAGQGEYVEYSSDAKAAQASVTFGTATADDFIVTAANAGTDYNNVSIVLQTSASVTTTDPTASYDENTKVLTVTINNGAATNLGKIRDAIEAVTVGGEQAFSVAADSSSNDAANFSTTTIDGSALGALGLTAGDEIGNTGNTGGEANTLFVYVEDGVSTAQNVIDALNNAKADSTGQNATTKRAAELFTFTNADDNDGSGKLFELTTSDALSGGVDGGGIAADGEEIVNAINATSGLSDLVTASLAEGNDGKNVAAAAFQEYAFTGVAANNNRLQFLGGLDSADIQLIAAGVDTALSITDNRGFANVVKDSDAANSALVFTAKEKGADLDGVRVVFVSDPETEKGSETVSYDADNKVLKFNIAADNEDASGNVVASLNTTAAEIITALQADDYASQFFDVSNFGTSDGTGIVDSDLSQAFVDLEFNSGVNVLRVRSNSYGTDGNDLQINLVDTNNAALSASFASDVLTITLDKDLVTLNDLETAINTLVGGQFTAEVIEVDDPADLSGYDGTFGTAVDFAGGVGTDADSDSVPDASASDAITSGGRGDALQINLATDSNGLVTTTANDLIEFFDDSANALLVNNFGISLSNAEGSLGTGVLTATTEDIEFTTSGISLVDQQAVGTSVAVNGVNARIQVTADQQGAAFDNVSVVLVNDDGISAGNEEASYDASSKTLTVKIDQANTTANQVISAINTDVGDLFTAAVGTGGLGTGKVTTGDSLTLTGGVVESGSVQGASFLGNADEANTGLTFESTRFGSDSFVSVKALSGTFSLTDVNGAASDRSIGTDINARVNGIQAVGRGLQASINTSSLDLSFSINSSVTDGSEYEFEISGGGALFQLGPDVVSNQQARLGIQSVSTATLGGVSGRLFELRSGGAKALNNDTGGAANIVEEVITVVTSLRGRLGAFQKTTLESNIFTLNDTLANLTDAESSIRDADFAAESARLTRAQILVQSGTSVLSIANSNPQNVLALLR